jgi:hypothetical protein
MPAGHAPFAIASLLRSPAHPLLSGQLTLITVTGRRSGREHTLPVAYKQDGEHLQIPVMWPERKLWWRNLRDGAEVRLRHRGEDRTGRARTLGEEDDGVSVEVQLDAR